MDVMADLALPLPAIVTAEMLGVPSADWQMLTAWSADFAQVLGNFQHNPERASQVIRSLDGIDTLLRRMPDLKLVDAPLKWRENLGLRGLTALSVTF